MNDRKKSILLSALALVLALALLAGCSLVSVDEAVDRERVVAKVGEVELLKGDLVDMFNEYNAFYQMYGMSITPEDVLNQVLILPELLNYHAEAKGYLEPSEEVRAEEEALIEEALKELYAEASAMAEEEFSEDPDINVETRTEELFKQVVLEATGEELTAEEFRVWYTYNLAVDRMYEDIMDEVTVTDEEVRAEYDAQLEASKAEMEATPAAYKTNQEYAETYETTPYLYTPEGYIRVNAIKVTPSGTLSEEYQANEAEMETIKSQMGEATLTGNAGDTDTAQLTARYNELVAANAAEKDEYLAKATEAINQAYQEISEGKDFNDVISGYDAADTTLGYTLERQNNKLLSNHTDETSTSDYPQSVKTATLAITAGTYTNIIFADNAYYIVQYIGAEPAGERDFAKVKDFLHDEVLTQKQQEEWNALVEEWMKDTAVVTTYPDVYSDLVTGAAVG